MVSRNRKNKKIRFGVVGVGYLGQHHVRILSNIKDIELVGIADINENRLKLISEQYHIQGYHNYRDLFGKIDAVTLVVPTRLHYSIGKEFLENKIPILIEKPISSTLQEAAGLIRISEKNKVILQIGHVERFNEAVVKLHEYLDKPKFIESHRLSSFNKRVKDIGVVLDLMIHDIDLILNIVQSDIKKIEAVGVSILTFHEDIANARITFKNGCIADLTASRISRKKMRKIRLFQSDAYFSLDYVKAKLNIYRKIERDGEIRIESEIIKTISEEPLKLELESFIQSIRENKPPLVSGKHGHNALKVALEITNQINKNII